MIVLPKEKPVLEKLNTYYTDVRRLVEHCQGEIGAGAIAFRSAAAKGVLFFDTGEILNACLEEKSSEKSGEDAIDELLKPGFERNFTLDIYQISQEDVYFWSNTPAAEKIYKDLTTDFTELEGLIKKMSAENLTGFIDVTINGQFEGGMVFFSGGEIVGGSFSWINPGKANPKTDLVKLIEKSKHAGGTFQVSRIPLSGNSSPPSNLHRHDEISHSDEILKMLEEFLAIFETLFQSSKIKSGEFNREVRRKFLQNADRFAFLDPFAAEFEYSGRKINFSGDAGDDELANGVIVSICELAEELNLKADFTTYLTTWRRKYQKLLSSLGIRL